MKLERLALWDEKYLFTEQGETDKGFIGWLKGCFDEDRLVLSDMVVLEEADYMIRYELESLCIFLASESAGYMLRTLSDLNAFCRDKVHDHVPYSFNRECWGFRVLTEDYAWYVALTPWNPKRHFTIHCYNRKTLMTALAKEKGLPEFCYGVLKYTGERILIRYLRYPCLRCGSRNLFRLPFFYGNGNALLALYARSRTFRGTRLYPI